MAAPTSKEMYKEIAKDLGYPASLVEKVVLETMNVVNEAANSAEYYQINIPYFGKIEPYKRRATRKLLAYIDSPIERQRTNARIVKAIREYHERKQKEFDKQIKAARLKRGLDKAG